MKPVLSRPKGVATPILWFGQDPVKQAARATSYGVPNLPEKVTYPTAHIHFWPEFSD